MLCYRGNDAAEVWGVESWLKQLRLHWFQGRMPFAQLGPVLSMVALRMFLIKELKSFVAVDHLLFKGLVLLNGSNGYSQDRWRVEPPASLRSC